MTSTIRVYVDIGSTTGTWDTQADASDHSVAFSDDQLTVERVYRELGPAVLGYFRAHGAAEPEDLLGDVFVDLMKGLDRFIGDERALRRWVFTIAHHRLVDQRRRRFRPLRPLPSPSLAPPADAAMIDPALIRALAMLTPDQRDTVVLRFVADLGINEVAVFLGRRPGAIKALQSRALARLVTILGHGAGDD